MKKKLIIGLSACLAGEKVRFDGGHRRDTSLLEEMVTLMFYNICKVS